MSEEKRRSDRVTPMVSDEEMVVIQSGHCRLLAKMLDLSESGTFVYLLSEEDSGLETGEGSDLSLYHQGKVFTVKATVARVSGRLVALRFRALDTAAANNLETKLIRMEVEWLRLRRLIG